MRLLFISDSCLFSVHGNNDMHVFWELHADTFVTRLLYRVWLLFCWKGRPYARSWYPSTFRSTLSRICPPAYWNGSFWRLITLLFEHYAQAKLLTFWHVWFWKVKINFGINLPLLSEWRLHKNIGEKPLCVAPRCITVTQIFPKTVHFCVQLRI